MILSTAIAALLTVAGAPPVNAQSVVGSGDLNPGPAQSPNWNLGSNGMLYVGDTGTATLTITDGGSVNSGAGVLGNQNGSQGTVTISGVGSNGAASTWTSAGDFFVGESGSGTLQIADGGAMNNAGTAFIGDQASGTGSVTVSGRGSNGSASTWSNSGDLVVGQSGAGTLLIEGGAAVSDDNGYIGGSTDSSVTTVSTATVTGRDSNGNASIWANAGQLTVGANGTGALNITDGGLVTNGIGSIGLEAGSSGTVTVSGSDGNGHASTWTSSGQIYIGENGTGSLLVEDGGVVNSDQGLIGGNTGGVGTATVTGKGSTWNTGNIYLGGSDGPGSGTLSVADGGTVSVATGNGGAASLYIGFAAGGQGIVNVSSTGDSVSTLTATDRIELGVDGTGTLNIGAGGFVSAGSDTYIAEQSTASGTLNLTGDANGRGVLETGSVIKGGGTTAVLNLDGGILRANRDEANFLNGFQTLTVGSEGAWFDTNGHDIGIATAFSGSSTFNKLGLGTLALTGDSSGFTGPTTISAGTLQLGDGGTTGMIGSDVTDNGTLAFDRSDAYTFAGTISGTGSVAQTGSGTTILTAANSYSGNTSVAAGTLVVGDPLHMSATLGTGETTVQAGATLAGYGTAPGSVTNAGTLAVANALPAFASDANGTFTIGGNLTNQGMANVAAASGQIGNVLEVGGNYVGANGQLALNTLLNEGGAATKTDRLVVAGNASGSTVIQIHATGIGVQTIGDGIEVVQVSGTSAANSFRLGNVIQSGAYQYLLYQGGTASANDWYLRSTLEAPPTTPTGPTEPPGGPTTTPPPPTAYRPGAVGYAMTPMLNADYGFTIMGRLNERVGDIASVEAGQPDKSSDGSWARIGGKDFDANANDQFSANEHVFFGQFGKDWTVAQPDQGGSTHAGVMMTLGSTSGSFDDTMRSINPLLSNATGSVETHAQSIGGYWTKYLADGAYFDGVGQFTHYHNKYSDIYGGGAAQSGYGAAASGEVGKPFKLGSSEVMLEPQAQLIYQYLHLSGTSDQISPISGTNTNGLRGRVGVRLFRPDLSNDSRTMSTTLYLTADVMHDFLTPGQTTVSDMPFRANTSRSWYDLGAGVTMRTGKSSVLYFNVKYARNLGGEYQRSIFGQAGYRYSW
ncbi:MAG TPA: autotransporter outer membrane beta-barrel domain-containing protein [Dyella sp.]|uniref:autotransporter outer membrane beta-barrel domain-containing protein n=1 Tax=Dyella sp. TaxID=1869338 RepID=UPI002F94D4E4